MNLYSDIVFLKETFCNLLLTLLFLALFPLLSHSQDPEWNWAKGVGGSHQDNLLGYSSATASGSMHVDTAGNVYEIIVGQSSSYTFGTFHFTNPGGSGANVAYFVKYDKSGTVVWARSFPRIPASAGGGSVIPLSMFTTQQGQSFLLFSFRDSLRLGSMLLVDTSIHITATTNNGYCVAAYDPAGNVISMKAHKTRHSSINSLYQISGNRILALGYCAGPALDTLDSHPVQKGNFLAIMDSAGNVLRLKTLGYDSVTEFLPSSSVCAGGGMIYLQPIMYRPYVYQGTLPIGDPAAFGYGAQLHLIIRLDEQLNFQWFRTANHALYTPMVSDRSANLYLAGSGTSQAVSDTLIFDTTRVPMPYLGSSSFVYHTLAKIDSSGSLQWTQLLPESGNGISQAICADQLSNVYVAGKYLNYIVAGPDTLTDPGNLFVIKFSGSGLYQWSQSTHLGGRVGISGISEDGMGNIYANGTFADPNFPVAFGPDTLKCTTPVNNVPLAADVFTARLGSCISRTFSITSSGAVAWCGNDSVILSLGAGQAYLWSTGDTASHIVVHASGLYSGYVTDSLGCYGRTQPLIVTAHAMPSVHATIGQNVQCFQGSDGRVSVSTSGGTLPYTLSYSPAVTDTYHMAAGTYAILLTDSFGCTARDTVLITQPATPLTVSTQSIQSTSQSGNGSAIALAAGATPPYSYLWSTEPAQTGDTASGLTAGWYYVTVSDAHGCSVSDSAYVRLYSGIAGEAADAGLRIYPNPSAGIFLVESIGESIEVTDMQGKIVMSKRTTGSVEKVDAEAWPAGVYRVSTLKGNERRSGGVVIRH